MCFETKVINTFYGSMKELYAKYIEAGCAKLEVNISSRTRMNIASAFGEECSAECVGEILKAMDRAVEEIASLLTEAALRHSVATTTFRSRV